MSSDIQPRSPQVRLADYCGVTNAKEAEIVEGKVVAGCIDVAVTLDEKRTWPQFIIAVDIGYPARPVEGAYVAAAGVLYDVSARKALAKHVKQAQFPSFEYIPGLLAFREIPILASLVETLMLEAKHRNIDCKRDAVLLCDGNGTLHPRRCGLARHLGSLYDLRSLGVAKNYHVGVANAQICDVDHVNLNTLTDLLGEKRGCHLPLYIQGELSGYMMRTQDGVRPLYVSAGHAIGQQDALNIALDLCTQYRQPEPIRQADQAAAQFLKELSS